MTLNWRRTSCELNQVLSFVAAGHKALSSVTGAGTHNGRVRTGPKRRRQSRGAASARAAVTHAQHRDYMKSAETGEVSPLSEPRGA